MSQVFTTKAGRTVEVRKGEAVCDGCEVMYMQSDPTILKKWAKNHAENCWAK